jgi:hypothetical protein
VCVRCSLLNNPVNFGSQPFQDIKAADGIVVRISKVGIIRQVVYAPPSGTGVTRGQDDLDLAVGLMREIPIVGHAGDWVGGVDHESTTFQNANTISSFFYVPHTQFPMGPVNVWNSSPVPPR